MITTITCKMVSTTMDGDVLIVRCKYVQYIGSIMVLHFVNQLRQFNRGLYIRITQISPF